MGSKDSVDVSFSEIVMNTVDILTFVVTLFRRESNECFNVFLLCLDTKYWVMEYGPKSAISPTYRGPAIPAIKCEYQVPAFSEIP